MQLKIHIHLIKVWAWWYMPLISVLEGRGRGISVSFRPAKAVRDPVSKQNKQKPNKSSKALPQCMKQADFTLGGKRASL